MKRIDFRKILQDRKILYLVLCIAVVSVFTLSIAYAAMSAVLEIHGNSEVVASSWDIHLENAKVKSGSVSANAPSISGTSSVGFDVELNMPGEFYEFTVDVVNDGSVDAMIDSVVKTPELTSEQAKYIKYEITYENGESISTKQTLKKGTSTPIKVRVEYRKDLVASDLPNTSTELSLKLTLVYVQSDGSGSDIPNNGAVESLVTVVSGDGTQVGNEVCIKNECFYVISSTDSTVTMLSKYNLYVGGEYNSGWTAYGDEATGIQDSTMLGYVSGQTIRKGTTKFSNTNYWSSTVSSYPTYVYDSNSTLYSYVENYKTYLSTLGVTPTEARLITKEELEGLGCIVSSGSCSGAPSWVYSTTYWSGSACSSYIVRYVYSDGDFYDGLYSLYNNIGCRPVITISRSLIDGT